MAVFQVLHFLSKKLEIICLGGFFPTTSDQLNLLLKVVEVVSRDPGIMEEIWPII